jgi:Kef-type K+ transport system membrane component KefB
MEAFTQLTIFLILIILLARLTALFSRKVGLPSVAVQLLVGILIGPSLFNFLGVPMLFGTWGSIPPTFLHSALKILAEIGLIQLMFLAGLQTDWRHFKTIPKPIFSLSSWSFVLTAIGVGIIGRWFTTRWSEISAMSAILAVSSLGISAYSFKEIEFSESRVANIVLGASIVSGLLAILLMIASQTLYYAASFGVFKMAIAVSWFVGKLIMFFAISYFLMSRFLNRVVKTSFEKKPRQMVIGYLLLMASLYAWGAMHFGSFAGVGIASLGGGLLGMADIGLREKMTKGLGFGMISLPVGLLFTVLGMEVNLKGMEGHLLFLAVLLATVVATKLIGGRIAARKVFESPRERTLIMVGALHQGEMGMLIAAYLFSRGVLNPLPFNIVIAVVVLLTIASTVMMRIAYYSPSPLKGRGRG